jgi:hypothetical protein
VEALQLAASNVAVLVVLVVVVLVVAVLVVAAATVAVAGVEPADDWLELEPQAASASRRTTGAIQQTAFRADICSLTPEVRARHLPGDCWRS